MEIILAQPQGFCAGVKRAIDIVEYALEHYSPKYQIYVLHEIVHNAHVVAELTKAGVHFVKSVDDVPSNAILIFSAHGVSRSVEDQVKGKGINIIDATCPLVSKVHREAQNHERKGLEIILIGHQGHPEIIGTSGRVNNQVLLVQTLQDVDKLQVKDPNKLAYVTQTTLSVDDTQEIINALKARFPNIIGPDLKDICYATQNRQNAVKELLQIVEMVLIVGNKNSSNSNRLLDLCQRKGVNSFLINSYKDVDIRWFENISKIGISSGASAPQVLVNELVDYLQQQFNAKVSILDGVVENINFNFRLPIFT